MDTCIGCKSKGTHPWVAVVSKPGGPTGRSWESAPVCDRCHRDPSHRAHPIKGHFFVSALARTATAAAGASDISA